MMKATSLQRSIWICTLAILIVSPNFAPFAFLDFTYDGVRLAVLCALFLGLLGLLLFKGFRDDLLAVWLGLGKWTRWLLLAALALGTAASLAAPKPGIALLETANFVALVLWSLALAGHLRSTTCHPLEPFGSKAVGRSSVDEAPTHAVIQLGLVISVSALLSASIWFISVALYVLSEHRTPPWNLPYLPLAHPRFLNQFQIVWIGFIAYAAGWLHQARYISLSRIAVIILGLWIAVMLSSEGRGVLLASIGAAGVLFIQKDDHSRALLRTLSIGLLIGGGIYLFAHFLLPLALGGPDALIPPRLVEYGLYSNGRLDFWEKAWHVIEEHPLLGGGPFHFRYYFPDLPAHPHGSIPQLGFEYGIPTTLILLTLFVKGGWWLYRLPPSMERSLFLLSMTGSALYSLVSGVIVMPLAQFSLALVTALMLGCLPNGHSSPKPSLKHHIAVTALTLFAAAILGYRLILDLPSRMDGSLLSDLGLRYFSSFWQIPHF